MSGADTVLRVIGAILAIVVILFVSAVGLALTEPIYQNTIDVALMESLGWGAPQDTLMMFFGLGFIGLSLVVIIWLIASPIRDDVRQSRRPRRRP